MGTKNVPTLPGWKANNYSRGKTQAIVDQVRATHPRAICLFGDPNIIGCRQYPGHDNHMHFDFGYEDMSPVAKEFLKTNDSTKLFKVVEKLQKERLEPGGVECQKALYDQIAKERYHENLCAKLAKTNNLEAKQRRSIERPVTRPGSANKVRKTDKTQVIAGTEKLIAIKTRMSPGNNKLAALTT